MKIKKGTLEKLLDERVFEFISENLDFGKENSILDSESIFNIDILEEKVDAIVNIQRVNNIRWINKFFEAVNAKLKADGIFIGCVEIYKQRKNRIVNKWNPVISYPFYFLDFLVKRVFSKLKITKWFYFAITRGQNRAISRAETYGRLYSCGFEFIDEREINNLSFFVFKKKRDPKYDSEPTYGPYIKLRRIGKNGKIIYVRKFRTMFAYSEYLQGFVFKENDLAEGGKFKDDFRVTRWGKIMRKLWLDELPMLLNWFNGDMKLVGVRPLSTQYFSLYDEEVQERRIKVKPGLIPPYYADMPKTLREIMDSEMRYLDRYEKNPIKTQWCYFWKAAFNIFFKRARSK